MSPPKISNDSLVYKREGPINFWIPIKPSNITKQVKKIHDVPRKSDLVFYNENQIFNRDLSIFTLKAWDSLIGPIDSLLEPLCASGIRLARYFKQGPRINTLIGNDNNQDAYELTKKNLSQFENVKDHIELYCIDARRLLTEFFIKEKYFSVIDIDPFGSPQPFVHDSVRILSNPGLLFVTATDIPVWTGKFPKKAYKKYGLTHYSIKNKSYCHEIAARALIGYIQREFLLQEQFIEPLLSISVDHYLRVSFIKKRARKDNIVTSTGFIKECNQCKTRKKIFIQNKDQKFFECNSCSSNAQLIGPLWLGKLHNDEFLNKIRELLSNYSKDEFPTINRLKKYINANIEENKIDSPWYFDLHWFSKRLNVSLPNTLTNIQKLREHGFNASITHFAGTGIKTNAQFSDLKEILLEK